MEKRQGVNTGMHCANKEILREGLRKDEAKVGKWDGYTCGSPLAQSIILWFSVGKLSMAVSHADISICHCGSSTAKRHHRCEKRNLLYFCTWPSPNSKIILKRKLYNMPNSTSTCPCDKGHYYFFEGPAGTFLSGLWTFKNKVLCLSHFRNSKIFSLLL